MTLSKQIHDRATIDHELVRRHGLSKYVRLAFPHIDPNDYVHNWHIDAGCEHLEALIKRDIRKLLILWPPGTMKSLLVSTLFPSWIWTFNPGFKSIFASYAQTLSEKNARLHRNLVQSDWWQERWGYQCQITKESSQKVREFSNNKMGFRFSTSVGGVLTGNHANLLAGDDLIKAQGADETKFSTHDIDVANDFWFNVMPSRQSNPKETLKLLIMQRLAHNDPAGKCMEMGGYVVLCMPMEHSKKRVFIKGTDLAKAPNPLGYKDPRKKEGELLFPKRYGPDEIKELKDSLRGKYEIQFNQNPTPPGGNLFKQKWFKYWGTDESRWRSIPSVDQMIIHQSWDMTFKDGENSDFVSGLVYGYVQGDHLLLDRFYAQVDYVDAEKAVLMMMAKWNTTHGVLIEDKANGSAIMSRLKHIPNLISIQPSGGKFSRAYSATAPYDGGKIYHPNPRLYPWVREYERNLKHFPKAEHDDDVDATSQYINYMLQSSMENLEAAMEAIFG